MAGYEVNGVSVSTLLGYINDKTIAIPEIQRPFVWESWQVRDLIDSLYKGYPVGYIIVWKSPDIKTKEGGSSEGKHILIDGQQRIVALTASVLGQEVLNKKYKKIRVKIAFNIKQERFETCNPSILKNDEWISDISSIMKDGWFDVVYLQQYSQKHEIDFQLVVDRVRKLQEIKNAQIGRIELTSKFDIDTVTEIFVRINSKGTALSQADFAMSKISVNETYEGNDIRKAIDLFCHFLETPTDFNEIKENDSEFASKPIFQQIKWAHEYNDNLYKPKYTDVLRVAFTYKFKRGKLEDLVSLLSGRDFETREYREDIIESSFRQLYEGVKEFVNETNYKRFAMIIKSTGIINEDLIRSQNVLNFSYMLYLLMREKDYRPEVIETAVKKWTVLSILTQRYSSSPESTFDYDIKRFSQSDDIMKHISDVEAGELSDAFWTYSLVNKFNSSVSSSPYLKLFIASQIYDGCRGFLSKSITVRNMIEERGDVHHIFPKDYLIKAGLDQKQMYNQIGNYVMLQQEINIAVSNKAPCVYFSELKEQVSGGPMKYGAIDSMEDLLKNLEENAIPREIFDMDSGSYYDFLDKRRKLMAERIKQYYKSL